MRQPQARFADDDVALDEDVIARETAGALKGMVVGGEAKGLSAPTTEAIKREARGGACEAWPRAFVQDGNPELRRVRDKLLLKPKWKVFAHRICNTLSPLVHACEGAH